MTSAFRVTILATLALAIGGVACSSDPNDAAVTTTPPTVAAPTTTTTIAPQLHDIVGTALTAGPFTELAGLVVDAGLVDTLRGAGPFTVFAPTDAAFAKLPVDTLHAVQDDPKLLATILTYHVVPGALKLADLKPGKLTTVAGIDLDVTRDGDTVLINGSPIVAGDVMATNGVVHVLGDVLLPPS
ncbi:MAG TPA: fasciclin domain-containing protein [Ilumatobacteraceae bacterium]|nr:fasciclin domain-containing protein [Ilumatobacteraceae bacterium]